jgi:hypothetical protein
MGPKSPFSDFNLGHATEALQVTLSYRLLLFFAAINEAPEHYPCELLYRRPFWDWQPFGARMSVNK